MAGIGALLPQWHLDERAVRERRYRAATPRERARWHARWRVARGWPEARVARALGRDAHTIGVWVKAFDASGLTSLAFEQTGGSPCCRRGGPGRVAGGGPEAAACVLRPTSCIILDVAAHAGRRKT
jgi:hypothetical protein